MHPVITIFCAFTRQWALDGWLENLKAVEHDPALTNLCFIVDGDQPLIQNTLQKFSKENNYRSFHVKMNTNWQANEVRLTVRRARIAEVKNQSKDLINLTDGEYIICFEDDTVFDRLKSFDRLLQPMIDDGTIGFVEGVQMGRWGAKIIGAWYANDISRPTVVKTLLPKTGYQEITGGGWYGYATRRQLYLDCDYYTSTTQPWGPDVNYGFYLRQRSYKCLIDWDTVFGHKDYGVTLYPDKGVGLTQVVYTKDEITGKWIRSDHEQANN